MGFVKQSGVWLCFVGPPLLNLELSCSVGRGVWSVECGVCCCFRLSPIINLCKQILSGKKKTESKKRS